MAILATVKSYLEECSLLSDYGSTINVEFLPGEVGVFSIEEVPGNIVVSTDILGNQVRQFTFIIACRFVYSEEAQQMIDNSGFMEDFSNWIDEQSYEGNLPDLGSNMTATEIIVETGAYLYNIAAGMRDARYQIQCRLLYDYERS